MGIRYIPEHKPSLKRGPRGSSADHNESATETTVAGEIEETHAVTASPVTPVAEVLEVEKPATVETVVEEKPAVVETAKDIRKKKP